MKGEREREHKLAVRLILCIWLFLSALLVSGCVSREEPVDYEALLSRVQEGDERQQALNALSDAWYHSECKFLDGTVEDMFFYGPKDRDKVTIVSVSSEPSGGQLIVYQVGTYEGYFLNNPSFGTLCHPPLQNAFEPGRTAGTQSP